MARDYKGFGNQGMTGIRLKDNPVISKDGLNHVGNEIEIVKVRKHQVDIKSLQNVLPMPALVSIDRLRVNVDFFRISFFSQRFTAVLVQFFGGGSPTTL